MADEPARDDLRRLDAAIDRYWDAVADGRLAAPAHDPDLDERLAATIRRVHALAGQPLPEPDRAERLWRNLMSGYAPTAPLPLTPAFPRPFNGHGERSSPLARTVSRPHRAPGRASRGLSFAATVALVALVLAMVFFVFRNGQQPAVIPAVQETPTAVATPATAPTAQSWPMWGGDPGRAKIAPGPAPTGQPALLWTYPAPGQTAITGIYDGGTLADGVLYIPGNTALAAIDAATGQELWRAEGVGGTVGGAIDGDGIILRGTTLNGAGYDLVRISRADGSEVWRTDQGQIPENATPIVADGVGYIPSGTDLLAFDPATGAERWRTPLQTPFAGGPAVSGGLVAVGNQQGTLFGIEAGSGDTVWSYPTGAQAVRGVSMANGTVYFSTSGGPTVDFYALDAATGAVKWRYPAASSFRFYGAAVTADTLYVTSEDGALYALDAATGALRWKYQPPGETDANSVVVAGDTVVMSGPNGVLYAVDAATGAERWRFAYGGYTAFVPIVAGGVVYVGTTDNEVFAIGGSGEATGATPVATAAGAGPTPSAAAVSTAVPGSTTGDPVTFVWASSGDAQHQLVHPGTLTLDPHGQIWVTSMPGSIFIFDLDGNLVETWGSPGSGPGQFSFAANDSEAGAVFFAPDGGFFVADWGNARVQQFDKDRNFVRSIGTQGTGDGQFLGPLGMALDARGNLLVSDGLRHDVQRFAPDGTFLGKFGGEGSGPGQFENPGLITVGPDGSLWIPDIGNNRVQILKQDGRFVSSFGQAGDGQGGFNGPDQVAFDGNGHAFVTDQFNNLVQVFDLQGHFLYQFGGFGTGDGQFNAAASVAVNRGSSVIVLDWHNNRIQKFKITGPFPTPAEATPTA